VNHTLQLTRADSETAGRAQWGVRSIGAQAVTAAGSERISNALAPCRTATPVLPLADLACTLPQARPQPLRVHDLLYDSACRPAAGLCCACLPPGKVRCCASATRCPFGCAGAAARLTPFANTHGPLPCGGMRRRATASHRSATPLAVQSGARAHPPVCPRPATARRSTAGRPSPKAPPGRRRPPAQPRRPFCARQPHEAPHSSPYIPRCRPPAAPQTRPGPRGPARARRPPGSRGPKPTSPPPGRLLLRPCCARAPCRGACASKRSPSAAHHSAHALLAFQLLLFEKQSTEALVTDANLQGCEPMQTCSLHEHGCLSRLAGTYLT